MLKESITNAYKEVYIYLNTLLPGDPSQYNSAT